MSVIFKKNKKKTSSECTPKSELIQYQKPYNSTVDFYKFLSKLNLFNKNIKNIIDIGTGIGSNLQYFSKQQKKINFLGTDYQSSRIDTAKKLNKNPKIKFQRLNILKSVETLKNKFEGLTCIHTICCFKKIEKVITNMCKINPKWIAINSLFFDGDLDVLIHIRDHSNQIKDSNPNGDFNIFSLSRTEDIFKKNGYEIVAKKPFFSKKKIKQTEKGKRGSYTMKTEIHNHTTFSGPVHLPWYFVIAKKIT
tara:strand:- start:484 stop:1233 length:750 start_codon:yes stop_codon:yes gene_type:complete